jgi:hypothetical protein
VGGGGGVAFTSLRISEDDCYIPSYCSHCPVSGV